MLMVSVRGDPREQRRGRREGRVGRMKQERKTSQ